MKRFIVLKLTLLLLFPLSAFAVPPEASMIIYGEVLVDGAPVLVNTDIILEIGTTQTTIQTVRTAHGLAYYSVEIPASSSGAAFSATMGDTVTIISIGGNTLSTGITFNWESGKSVKKDILENTTTKIAPELVLVSADKSGTTLSLSFTFKPVTVSVGETVSYNIVWYAVSLDTADPPATATSIKTDTLTGVTAQKKVDYSVTNFPDYKYLELTITPVLSGGELGISAYKRVIPVVSSGGV